MTEKHISEDNNIKVQSMFDGIAFRYDFLNRFFSFGIDKIWRAKAVNELRAFMPEKVLDVATGTADMAIALQKKLNNAHITGVDISEKMLAIGKQKVKKKGLEQHIKLEYGNSEALPFDQQSFDAVTVAFGVRNFENLKNGLDEMYRVLKTGGKVIIIELSIPQQLVAQYIFKLYFFRILPYMGRFLSKHAYAYSYLPHSVQSFPYGAKFKEKMESCGFSEVGYKSLTFGIAHLYKGNK